MPRRKYAWEKLSDEQLLKRRLSSLRVTIEGTWLEDCLADLHEEMEERGLRLRPHAWISSEWFSPDDTPGIAIPFYLAHPRLMKLEKQDDARRRGRHAVRVHGDPAPRGRPRRAARLPAASPAALAATVRPSSKRYPSYYRPNPASRRYVQHLRLWYAQSHPDEDFAETFAVWLRPRSNWRTRYADWPALKKLEYVDELMEEIAGEAPVADPAGASRPLNELSTDAGRALQEQAGASTPSSRRSIYDRDSAAHVLRRSAAQRSQPASSFLRRNRADIRKLVAQLDRRVPAHARRGARRHDRPLPRTEAARGRS